MSKKNRHLSKEQSTAADYKKRIEESKASAQKQMTAEQLSKCKRIIHGASAAAGAGAFVPVPVMDAIPITAAQVTMVISLGRVFDQEIPDTVAKSIINAAAATLVGRTLVKFIPFVGWAVSASVAAGVTEAIGWIAAADFAKKYGLMNKANPTEQSSDTEAKTVEERKNQMQYEEDQSLTEEEEAERDKEELHLNENGRRAFALEAEQRFMDAERKFIAFECKTEGGIELHQRICREIKELREKYNDVSDIDMANGLCAELSEKMKSLSNLSVSYLEERLFLIDQDKQKRVELLEKSMVTDNYSKFCRDIVGYISSRIPWLEHTYSVSEGTQAPIDVH